MAGLPSLVLEACDKRNDHGNTEEWERVERERKRETERERKRERERERKRERERER